MHFRRICIGAVAIVFAATLQQPNASAADATNAERERIFLATPTAEGALATARAANWHRRAVQLRQRRR